MIYDSYIKRTTTSKGCFILMTIFIYLLIIDFRVLIEILFVTAWYFFHVIYMHTMYKHSFYSSNNWNS